MANVQLMPDPTILSVETGPATARPSASPSRPTRGDRHLKRREVVCLYVDGAKYILEDIPVVLAKANQALATLDKYRTRLDQVSTRLPPWSSRAARPCTTCYRAAAVRAVTRMAVEIERYIVELGTEGRLIEMQLEETMVGTAADKAALIHDYLADPRRGVRRRPGPVGHLRHQDLLDFGRLAEMLGTTASSTPWTIPCRPVATASWGGSHDCPSSSSRNREGVRRAGRDARGHRRGAGGRRGRGRDQGEEIREGLRSLQEINLVDRYLQT